MRKKANFKKAKKFTKKKKLRCSSGNIKMIQRETNKMPKFNASSCFWANYNNVMKWRDLCKVGPNPGVPHPSNFTGGECSQKVADDDSDSSDYVMTEEMMKFLEINMKHKESLRKEKEKLMRHSAKTDCSDRDLLDECKVPTTNEDEMKRKQELDILYGVSAPMIHGMETALQLAFNRKCDKRRPVYWPVHSFHLVFKGPEK